MLNAELVNDDKFVVTYGVVNVIFKKSSVLANGEKLVHWVTLLIKVLAKSNRADSDFM